MIEDEIVEVVALVSISGLFAAVAATLVGVPVGALVGRNGGGHMVRAAAVGMTRLVTPAFVVAGVVVLLAGFRLQLTFTVTVMVLVQISVGLAVMIGSTARAIEALPRAAIDQLDALHLSRYHETRILVVEVWPAVVASILATFAAAVAIVGGSVVAGAGPAGETELGTPIFIDEAAVSPAQTAGFLLLGLAITAALSRLPIGRLR